MTSKTSLNKLVIMNIVGTFIYQGINFLVTPILARILGTYDFGVVTLYNTWTTFFVPVLGLSTSVVIPYIKLKYEEKEQHQKISSVIGLSILACVIFGMLYFAFMPFLQTFFGFNSVVMTLLYLQAVGMVFVNFFISYFVQYQKTIQQFLVAITVSVLSFVFTILFWFLISNQNEKYLCKILGFAIPNVLFGIIAIVYFYIKGKRFIDITIWRIVLPICIPVIFHSLSHIVLAQSDKVMIQNLTINGVENAAIYGFAHTIASVGNVLWTALNNAWTPYYYDLLKVGDYNQIKYRAERYMLSFTTLFCMFFLIIPEFVKIMGANKYNDSLNIIPILYLGMYFIFLYSFSVNYKTVCNQTISIAIGTIGAAICNIGLNYIMVPYMGGNGAAIASLISYVMLFVFHHFSVKENGLKYTFSFGLYLKGIIGVGICTLAYYVLFDILIARIVLFLGLGMFELSKIKKWKALF